MKTNTLLALSVIAVGTLFAAPAHAGWSVNVSIGGRPHPAPVVVAPPVCAPPVVVCPPSRVVCPPPRPACPPVVYMPPCHVWGRHDYAHREYRDSFHHDRDGRYGNHDCDGRGFGHR